MRITGTPPGVRPYEQSGRWVAAEVASTSSVQFSGDVLLFAPIWLSSSRTLDRIACEIVTAGSAGCVYRMGIYADDGNGLPSALLLDAGTVAADSTGVKEIVISQVVSAPLFWLAGVTQGSPATLPFVRRTNGAFLPINPDASTQINNASLAPGVSGVTGALPADAAVPAMNTWGHPRLMARVA